MLERHLELLRHVGLYRVSLRAAMARMPFGGKTLGNVLQTVRNEGLLVSRPGLGGTLSYYQLTRSGTTLLGLPEDRAKPFAAQALHTHLAILSFCCLGPSLRVRVDRPGMRRLFANRQPAGDYCLENVAVPRLLRVYAPAVTTSLPAIRARILELVAEGESHPVLSGWMTERRYAFAVLVGSPERRKQVWDFVRGKGGLSPSDQPVPMSVAHFAVESVPQFGLRLAPTLMPKVTATLPELDRGFYSLTEEV